MTTPKKIVICLAGLTASGKSTVAKRLAKEYGLTYISGGTALKELALKRGYKAKDKGWWETAEGIRFLEERQRDQKYDREIDHQLLEWAGRGNVVLDSWTMPWISKKGFKIWLEVSSEERTKRLAHRDGITLKDAAKVIKEKDGSSEQIYERIYGFKLGEDYSPFNLILDCDLLSSDDVFDTLRLVIARLVFKRALGR